MDNIYTLFFEPFLTYPFMARSLLATFGLALACGPLGILLILRRMSLMGDALSHAVLPGIALGYLIAGLSLPAMSGGGILAGIIVVLLGGLVARKTKLSEDASFTGFYLIALALGVFLMSLKGGTLKLSHLLFGSILAVDQVTLIFITAATTLTLLILAVIYRPLVYECFDSTFTRLVGMRGSLFQGIFLTIVVINLVAACHAMGTLMSLGIMMLPAITARLWGRQVWSLFLLSILIAMISGYIGLLVSYHFDMPSGPTIVLVAGGFYIGSICISKFFDQS